MTTTEDLYQQAIDIARIRIVSIDSVESAIRAVVDLVLAARPELNPTATDADASNPEHLRFVNRVLRRCSPNHLAVDRIYIDRIIGATAHAADRLEAEHRAAQEKAAAEAEREKLIEQAARLTVRGVGKRWESITESWRRDARGIAVVLVDAGWRPALESDGGAA
ncbi:hypothetical protein [Gordonia sihwensis]|uniref:hypothetical protein n=1 Tax=Gordonia sihwensis TaxID=173559 RepID=UPI00241746B4|nr:hypothetical protein [Gordonia sihwensis]WFN91504.1 hypothetical protein P5P27_11995 [Gordonia sihwensis]WFN91562.1 hypothetical protein P5P27_12285 [Gordonia sihwensis]